jgi:hypothetical protein
MENDRKGFPENDKWLNYAKWVMPTANTIRRFRNISLSVGYPGIPEDLLVCHEPSVTFYVRYSILQLALQTTEDKTLFIGDIPLNTNNGKPPIKVFATTIENQTKPNSSETKNALIFARNQEIEAKPYAKFLNRTRVACNEEYRRWKDDKTKPNTIPYNEYSYLKAIFLSLIDK